MNAFRLLIKVLSACALTACFCIALNGRAEDAIKVGTDASTEANVIGEILRQTVASESGKHGAEVIVSGDLFDSVLALIEGRIEVYPVGLDRLAREIVVIESPPDLARVNEKLSSQGLGVAAPLGFKRTYALAVSEEFARSQRLKTISDLLAKSNMRFGFSRSFMSDPGGFARLTKQGTFRKDAKVKELKSHDREKALNAKQIDVIDVVATDPAIRKYRLMLLTDDQSYFASHDVVLLHRLDVAQRHPQSWDAMLGMENTLSEKDLLELNWRVDSGASTLSNTVKQWRATRPAVATSAPQKKITTHKANVTPESENIDGEPAQARPLMRMAQRHVMLVFVGLFFSVLIGVPLGIWASGRSAMAQFIHGGMRLLGITPFLALLVFSYLIWQQFGTAPAIFSLFACGLWPIVAHTVAGLRSVPAELIDAATLQNLSGRERLSALDLPMAMGAIGQGIQRCAVINVGTATVAALFGAGGFGEAILEGVLNESARQMLVGAVAATLLAVAIYFVFGCVARALTPTGVSALASPEG